MARVPELDALRGIAALTVVVYHVRFLGYPLLGSAVDLFFILSGYLITTIIFQSSQRPHFFRNFYIRRALRIWPIYYLTFPIFFIINPLLPHPASLDGVPYLLTYTQFIQGYWSAPFPDISRLYWHTWTLAVEEQFYLFWPWLVVLAGRRLLTPLVVVLIFLPTVLRGWGVHPHLLLTRCDGLALGALLAVLLADGDRWRRRRGAFGLGFALVGLFAFSMPLWREVFFTPARAAWPSWNWEVIFNSVAMFRVTLIYFGVVGVVLCFAGHPRLRILRWRRFCQLGQISYGLYLFHPFVGKVFEMVYFGLGFGRSKWMDMIDIVLCVVVAALSWRFIEKPILALKDRFTYDSPAAASGGPGAIATPSGTLRGPHERLHPSPSSTPADRA